MGKIKYYEMITDERYFDVHERAKNNLHLVNCISYKEIKNYTPAMASRKSIVGVNSCFRKAAGKILNLVRRKKNSCDTSDQENNTT